MIFVTVGTQLPFDRLIREVDRLASEVGLEVFAQTGNCSYKPRSIRWEMFVSPGDFEMHMEQANLLISHAGVGSILAAQRFGKPIVICPRFANLGEHRNDHQVATCKQLIGRPGITVAFEMDKLRASIDLASQGGPMGTAGTGRLAFVSNLKMAIDRLNVSRPS